MRLSHLIYTVRPCLIHTCHAMPMPCFDHAVLLKATVQHERRPCCAVALRSTAWSAHGMASVNQTRPHCINQMGKTHSKPLAARHGRGTAWARYAMCESAFKLKFRDLPTTFHSLPFCNLLNTIAYTNILIVCGEYSHT